MNRIPSRKRVRGYFLDGTRAMRERVRISAFVAAPDAIRYDSRFMKPTFRPNNRRRKKKIGFRARMKTAGGRSALSRRRQKKRHRIAA